ncbi:MAG: hypothetical protein HQK65_21470 [Desulfamplus sp.]|nr:hypothetical protein [Desulfamplus sp.]
MKSEKVRIFTFALFLFGIALFYSGGLFIKYINEGIPSGVINYGVHKMLPGDHHEQFYRYSLVYENLIKGRMPYYTGYQFASTEFSEGLVFFPFSFIVGLLTFVFGPILSYNLLLLFSYVFVGLAGFFMVRQMTKSDLAGIVSGVFLATVPFRTSFLYGQMVYGVDAVMVPLLIYAVERTRKTGAPMHFFIIGLLFFLTATANFQLFYFAMIILWPYFLYVLFVFFRKSEESVIIKLKPVLWILPGLFACMFYLLYIYYLMKNGALHSGKNFAETLFYTPEPYRIFNRYNGNEKNVYLGLTALLVVPWMVSPMFRCRIEENKHAYIPLFTALLIFGMYLVFGPIIDNVFKLPIYKWMFDHIPGFNGTRTPGRIMAVNVVLYAILLGYFTKNFVNIMGVHFSKLAKLFCVAFIVVLIVWDFNYLKPGINTFASENKAYKSIAEKQTKIVTLPFQFISANYLNSTFLPLALKYDVRIFSGHSSFYPKKMDQLVPMLFSLNDGFIDHQQWKFLIENEYKYIIAHATVYRPNVDASVLSTLHISPYLKFLESDQNVYLYKVKENPTSVLYSGLEGINYEAWADAINNLPQHLQLESGELINAYGWHVREVYPEQRPFRWMNGVESLIVVGVDDMEHLSLMFEYNSPYRETLKISSYLSKVEVDQKILKDGWVNVKIRLSQPVAKIAFIKLEVANLFKAPPDTREFGCQISDFVVE